MRSVTLIAMMLALAVADAVRAGDSPVDRVRAFAGERAKDCGSLAPGAISEPCLVQAFRDHVPAYWVSHTQSRATPAALAYGLTASGRMLVVTRSTPEEALEAFSCSEAAIVVELGKERLRCKERYVAPPHAGQVPFRVSAMVTPPQPLAPLTVDPAICPLGNGRKLQVELVVGEDGRVRMVDVLAAPQG